METEPGYEQIRPYIGEEIPEAVLRLSHSEEFLTLFSRLLKWDREQIAERLQKVTTRQEFQDYFFAPITQRLIETTTEGVTVTGLEHLKPEESYLFVSNHRDIILDSAILNILLNRHGLKYCQAAIGSNLLMNEWVTDLVKLDACFIIERNLPVKEMVISAGQRSQYIRDLLTSRENSVWIAQKEGRTKDGNDRTQPSLLKMFKMSGSKDFSENFRELRIVPVAISYEWEPCDYLKTSELSERSAGEYVKTPAADMTSMYQGLADYKGRVNFAVGKPIGQELDEINLLPNNGDRIEALAKHIDKVIHSGFKLWPNNYIAYDLLHGSTRFMTDYTRAEKEQFIQNMRQKIDRLSGNRSILNNIYLEIYANPVQNRL